MPVRRLVRDVAILAELPEPRDTEGRQGGDLRIGKHLRIGADTQSTLLNGMVLDLAPLRSPSKNRALNRLTQELANPSQTEAITATKQETKIVPRQARSLSWAQSASSSIKRSRGREHRPPSQSSRRPSVKEALFGNVGFPEVESLSSVIVIHVLSSSDHGTHNNKPVESSGMAL